MMKIFTKASKEGAKIFESLKGESIVTAMMADLSKVVDSSSLDKKSSPMAYIVGNQKLAYHVIQTLSLFKSSLVAS